MVLRKVLVFLTIGICAQIVTSQLPPACSIGFKPKSENFNSKIIVKNLGPNDYHVKFENKVEPETPSLG